MQKLYDYNTEQIGAPHPAQKTNKLKRMHLVSNAMSTILEESATSKVQQCKLINNIDSIQGFLIPLLFI